MEVYDNRYRLSAIIDSIDKTVDKQVLESLDLTVESLIAWTLKEKRILPANIPSDEASLKAIFSSAAEAAYPSVNGGSKKYAEKMYEIYETLVKRFQPLIGLNAVDIKYEDFKFQPLATT